MSFITLTYQHIDAVIWDRAELCDFNLDDRIDIWQINVSSNLPRINDFLNILDPPEITRANKYLRESDRNRFIVSRGSLRFILSRYLNHPAATIRFKLAANNKPFITYPTISQLHFNLSDSADKVMIAVARSAIGTDIELVKPDFKYHDILNNNFNAPETDYINRHDNYKRFFLLWTRKEAILKATGMGLTDHLKQIPALDGEHLINGELLATKTNWLLHSFEPAEGYIATIASDGLVEKFRFWNFSSK